MRVTTLCASSAAATARYYPAFEPSVGTQSRPMRLDRSTIAIGIPMFAAREGTGVDNSLTMRS